RLLAVEGDRHVDAVQALQGDGGRHRQRDALVGGAEEVVEAGPRELARDGTGVELAEARQLRAGAIGAGVDEVGRPAPALGGEVAEAQRAGREHEADEFGLGGAHGLKTSSWVRGPEGKRKTGN